MRRFWALLSTMAVAGLCGCTATAEHRPHHSVTISSEPAGAACLLTGGAEPITEVAATPAVVRLPQSPRDVRVFCTSPGRAPVATILPAETEAKQVAAAVLLYGAAPAAIATMMGAARSYAPKLDVALPPMRFAPSRSGTGSSRTAQRRAGATSNSRSGRTRGCAAPTSSGAST